MYCSTTCVINSRAFAGSLQDERCPVLNSGKLGEILRLFEGLSLDSKENLGKNGDLGFSDLKIQEKGDTEMAEVSLEERIGPSNAIEGYVPHRESNSKPLHSKKHKEDVMEIQCFSWILYLWGQLVGSFVVHNGVVRRPLPDDTIIDGLLVDSFIVHKGVVRSLPDDTIIEGPLVDSFIVHKGVVRPLPDDIIIDILCRLPAEFVLTCRVVCKKWRALTSTSYFAELHLKRSTPVCVIQNLAYGTVHKNELDLLIFDEKAKKDKMMKKIRIWFTNVVQQNWLVLVGSCNGLLVFQPMYYIPVFYVCNPITQEQMTLRAPIQRVQFCGFFFHPIAKEYRLLCVHSQGNCFGYIIYSLQSKLWRHLAAFSYRPPSSITPAIVNGALHWILEHKHESKFKYPSCSNSIMVFNMNKEDFHTMPHPEYKCLSWQNNEKSQLLEMKEQLSLCHFSGKLIDIWVLEDYANWIWVKRYMIDLAWDVRNYHYNAHVLKRRIRFVNIQNDGLLLDWYSRGFFRYHLRRNVVWKLKLKGKKIHGMLCDYWESTTYTKSFISLRGFSEAK